MLTTLRSLPHLLTAVFMLCLTGCLTGQTDREVAERLPSDTLKLRNFTATRSSSPYIVLEWRSLPERDNDHYLLERSDDGALFTVVGRVTGHGTTDRGYEYNFFDCAGSDATLYYRVTQVDFGGTTHRTRVYIVPADRVDRLPVPGLEPDSLRYQVVTLLPGDH